MAECITCKGYTKYNNGYCSKCYKLKETTTVPTSKITKKEERARSKSFDRYER